MITHVLSLAFRTPNLVFLDYSSYVAQDYLVQFDDSLVEARLDIRLWKYYDHVTLPLPLCHLVINFQSMVNTGGMQQNSFKE